MKPEHLAPYVESATAAAREREERLGAAIEKVLARAGRDAARNFVARVTEHGDQTWSPPHEDEVLAEAALAEQIGQAILREQRLAMKAYVRELPSTVQAPAPLAAAGKRRPAPKEGEITIAWDVTSPYFGKVYRSTGASVGSITQTTRAKVMKVISDGYLNGDSVAQVAEGIRASIRGSLAGRARMIARTELTRLTNGATVSTGQVVAQATGIGYAKEWLTAPGAEHPRHELYEGLDGQTVGLDELFDVEGEPLAYPGDPDGDPGETINCFPAETLVETPGLRAVMRRWYEGEMVTLRFASGDELTATPNHPVLRIDGTWTPIGELVEGDHLVRATLSRDALGTPDPDRPPAEFGELHSLASVLAEPKRVRLSPPDLHGDASEGEVEVVPVDGSLLVDSEAASDEQLKEFGFATAARARARLGNGPRPGGVLDLDLERVTSSGGGSPSHVGRLGERSAVVLAHASEAQAVRHAGSPDRQTEFVQSARDHAATDSEAVAHGENALALFVEATEVLQVDRHSFLGHVYNLDSGEGWYIGNRIIVANCRCTLILVESGETVEMGDADAIDESDLVGVNPFADDIEAAATVAVLPSSAVDDLLPLSDRDTAWDSGETLTGTSASGEGFFWLDGDVYRLPFARLSDGTLSAVWRGVVAAAAALQGEVALPDSDLVEVRARIAAYYELARAQYGDPEIQVPWQSKDGETLNLTPLLAADRLAYAEALSRDEYEVRLAAWLVRLNEFAEIPESADYRPATVAGERCGTCSYFAQGNCSMWDTTVDSDYVCNEWETEQASVTADAVLPDEHQPRELLPEANDSPSAPAVVQRTNAAQVPFHVRLAPEGKATDDGRIFAPGSVGWRALPLSLMAMTETSGEGGHAGAELAGRIDSIYRNEDSSPVFVEGDGVFNDDEKGAEIAGLVEEGFLTGNSVDLAVLDSLICRAADIVDENGEWRADVNLDEVEPISIIDLFMGEVDESDDILYVVKEAVIGMSTVCPFPAFADATIAVTASGEEMKWLVFQGVRAHLTTCHLANAITVKHADDALTASAAGLVPVVPPREWFALEEPDELTPLTVTEDGQVFGHAWQWGECHIGLQDACTVAPANETGYAYFLLKECESESGPVEVGTVTLDTNHAGRSLDWQAAASHYDHTGTAIADVVISDGELGGWFCGALRPDASVEAVRKFRGASVSGDWRRIHGKLELVGLLSVNVPGFPIPRARALVAAAAEGAPEVLTLIAAGIPGEAPDVVELNESERAELSALARGDRWDDLSALAAQARTA